MRKLLVVVFVTITLALPLISCSNKIVEKEKEKENEIQKETVIGTVQSFYITKTPNFKYFLLSDRFLNQGEKSISNMYKNLSEAIPVYNYYTTFTIEGYEEAYELKLFYAPQIGEVYLLTLNNIYKDGELVSSYLTY